MDVESDRLELLIIEELKERSKPSQTSPQPRKRNPLSLTGVIVSLMVGVVLPILLSTSVGIVNLVLGEDSISLVISVLMISFTAAAIGGVIIATVLLRRRARVARLQADFLTSMAHELKTPLSAIRLYAQILQSGQATGDPEQTHECLETIVRESVWLETLIDRALSWRAAAQDRDVMRKRRAPLGGAIQTALDRFAELSSAGELQLSLNLRSQAIVLHDPDVISSALLNLLINAYKYTEAEKCLRFESWDEGGIASLSLRDNGVGIPSKELKRIFEPFYRVDSSLQGIASGAGLGLAIVNYTVEAHGGEILVESVLGEGSHFLLKLPICTEI